MTSEQVERDIKQALQPNGPSAMILRAAVSRLRETGCDQFQIKFPQSILTKAWLSAREKLGPEPPNKG